LPDDDASPGEEREGELDYSGERPLDRLEPPAARPYDPEPQREKVRAHVTYGLIAAVCLYALVALIALIAGWTVVDELEAVVLFFTPLITLTGTALGFYFGGKQSR
jgi:hypothetical protein